MKIGIAGYYGYGNVGDELILKVILSESRRKNPDAEIVVLSANPQQTRENHGVNSISRWNPFSVIKTIWRCDLFLLGGGGLLQDKTSLLSLGYYVSLIALARFFRCAISLYAIGVETVRRPLGKKLIFWALSAAALKITVRDIESKEALAEMGIDLDKIYVTGDPVFNLVIPMSATHSDDHKKILFIPRFPCQQKAMDVYSHILDVVREEASLGIKGLLFQNEREHKYQNRFPSFVEWQDEIRVNGKSLDPLFDLVSSVDLVISARFHGLVLAALKGKPFIGVGESDKVGRLCRAWGMPYLSWDASKEAVQRSVRAVNDPDRISGSSSLDLWKHASSLTMDLTDSWFKTVKKF